MSHHAVRSLVPLALTLAVWCWQAALAQGPLQGFTPPGKGGAIRRGTTQEVSSATSSIGVGVPQLSDLVIDGDPAPQYRYVVGISYVRNGREALCTGTLVGKNLVLTAAHCGCGTDYRVTQALRMRDAQFIRVQGPPILFDLDMCRRSVIRGGFDLALLRLAGDAEIKPEYRPLPLLAARMAASMQTGTDLLVVGYGLTEQRTSGVRMQAFVPVFTPDCARLQYIAAGCEPYLEMILSASARTEGSRRADTCSGDSGGPVFAMRAVDGDLMPALVAVTSRPAPIPHVDRENHCGGGGFYTVVGRKDVRAWLKQNGVEESSD